MLVSYCATSLHLLVLVGLGGVFKIFYMGSYYLQTETILLLPFGFGGLLFLSRLIFPARTPAPKVVVSVLLRVLQEKLSGLTMERASSCALAGVALEVWEGIPPVPVCAEILL